MEPCKILVVDDEQDARERLARMIADYPKKTEVEFASNGLECLEKTENIQPDIVLLDIQMPGMTGIEVIQQIKCPGNTKFIFQTAFDQFAIQAFDLCACDYLLKPIRESRLTQALDKVFAEAERDQALEQLRLEYKKRSQFVKKLTVKAAGKLIGIPVESIYYMQVQEDYTAIYTTDGEFLTEHPLSHLENILPANDFFRCHQSFMVNMQKLASLQRGRNMLINLTNGIQIPVSRRNRERVKGFMTN